MVFFLSFGCGIEDSHHSAARSKARGIAARTLFHIDVSLLIYSSQHLLARQDTAQGGMRIPRPKIEELALQAQSAGIFATGEYPYSTRRELAPISRNILQSPRFYAIIT